LNKNQYKYLNIKGAILDNYQLQKYMEKIATNHDLNKESSIFTYPIPRLKENYNYIKKTYDLLNKHMKIGIEEHPAGEWLLDNFYIIEETVKTIENNIDIKKYKSFSGLQNGMYKGYARIYVLASEIVAYTDNKITDEILKLVITSYQKRKTLAMAEIWNLWIFLEIAIIENIRNICERIYSGQLQKYKVENIIERLLEKKDKSNQNFKLEKKLYKEKISYKEMKYPFIEHMSYRLKKYGKKAIPYLEILEEEVSKMGISTSECIEKEHYDMAISKVSMGNSITSLKEILRINFLNLFEEINGVESVLKKDPANIYSKMDYKTKEYYRNKIKEISEKTKISEIYIANKALNLCLKNNEEVKKHIGYYLISDGYAELMNSLQIKVKTPKNKSSIYINSIWVLSIIFSIIISLYTYYKTKKIYLAIITGILLYMPISEIIIQIINYILNKVVKPKILPKMDFINGIPNEYKTMVVIPTIVNNKEKVKELFKKLEVYYMANKSSNIYFTLLGDCTQSKNELEKFDEEVIEQGIKECNKLNEKYKSNDKIKLFNFIYRKRIWNDKEESFLGWERKRGLLMQFNKFLLTGEENFRTNTIEYNLLKNKIKYVITLDSDTNLILESGLELIGTMAHILNKPVVENGIVTKGHAIIQPRVRNRFKSQQKKFTYPNLCWTTVE